MQLNRLMQHSLLANMLLTEYSIAADLRGSWTPFTIIYHLSGGPGSRRPLPDGESAPCMSRVLMYGVSTSWTHQELVQEENDAVNQSRFCPITAQSFQINTRGSVFLFQIVIWVWSSENNQQYEFKIPLWSFPKWAPVSPHLSALKLSH